MNVLITLCIASLGGGVTQSDSSTSVLVTWRDVRHSTFWQPSSEHER